MPVLARLAVPLIAPAMVSGVLAATLKVAVPAVVSSVLPLMVTLVPVVPPLRVSVFAAIASEGKANAPPLPEVGRAIAEFCVTFRAFV